MIDTFSKTQFEDALPRDKVDNSRLWVAVPNYSEYCYVVPVNDFAVILVLSSIPRGSNKSAGLGENSIRAWVVAAEDYDTPLSSKDQAHIKRTKNWKSTLTRVLRELYKRGLLCGLCPHCRKAPTRINKAKKDGKWFLACSSKECDKWIRWIKEGEIG